MDVNLTVNMNKIKLIGYFVLFLSVLIVPDFLVASGMDIPSPMPWELAVNQFFKYLNWIFVVVVLVGIIFGILFISGRLERGPIESLVLRIIVGALVFIFLSYFLANLFGIHG